MQIWGGGIYSNADVGGTYSNADVGGTYIHADIDVGRL